MNFPAFNPVPLKGGYREADKWVWCGSVLEEPRVGFHLYASRWRKDYPMLEGYVLFSEIVHAFSERLEGPYRFVEKVLPASPRGHWDAKMAHNPCAMKYGDDGYLLFYIGTDYDFEAPSPESLKQDRSPVSEAYSQIHIGVARSSSPAGPWIPNSEPILTARSGKWDASIVTNPAPCVTPDGKIYLYYRSNTANGLRIGLAVANSPDGPYERFDEPVLQGANVEDPFAWHDGKLFNIVAKDMTGDLTGEFHAGAHFTSADGIKWEFRGKAYSRNVLFDDGQTRFMGSLERPQMLFWSDGTPRALFAATADGPGGFQKADNTWNICLPFSKK